MRKGVYPSSWHYLSTISTTPPGPEEKVHRKNHATNDKKSAVGIQHLKREGRKISMITAYDYPSARHASYADFDIILIGDSVGMVCLGYDSTQPVTMSEMVHHCKAVRRGAPSRFLIGDMPFGSYESSPVDAFQNAALLVKEGNVDAVKIEGGVNRVETVQKLVDGGIAVMGHIGLTPQAISVIGGFRAQGKTAVEARQLIDDALALQKAGVFAVVIECVPANVAEVITNILEVPTIGIGAGNVTSGQVLVYHDVLGMLHHPHHEKHGPKFCKKYAHLGIEVHNALSTFRNDIITGSFPSDVYSPYKMDEKEARKFHSLLEKNKELGRNEVKNFYERVQNLDENEIANLY